MDRIKAIQLFSDYLLHERHYSKLTKEAYIGDIKDFFNFLSETGESQLENVSLQDARIYLGYLTDKEYNRNSISRKISSLRSFYNFLLKNHFVKENPFSYLSMKKHALTLPNFFYSEEIEQLFKAAEGNDPLDYRNR